jgi:hypothetical protein
MLDILFEGRNKAYGAMTFAKGIQVCSKSNIDYCGSYRGNFELFVYQRVSLRVFPDKPIEVRQYY